MRRLLIDQRLTQVASVLALLQFPLLLWSITPPDVCFSLLAILFLIHSALVRDFSWLRVRWMQAGLLFGLYLGARGLFNTPLDWEIVGYGLTWIRYPLGAGALAYWMLRDERIRRYFFATLAALVIFVLADCFFQFCVGYDLFGRPIVVYEDIMRLTGPFKNPRPAITLVWLVFPLMLPWLTEKRRWQGALLLAFAAVIIFLSGERMALMLYAMGIGLSFLLLPRARIKLAIMAVVAGLLCLFFAQHFPIVKNRQVNATHKEVGGFRNNVYGRTWLSAASIGNAHPLFGAGLKQFQKECAKPEYGPTDKESLRMRCPMHAHNIYLATYAESGGIGVGLFILTILFMLRDLWWARRHWWGHALATGLIVTLTVRFWPLSVTPSAFTSWSCIPLWVAVGWLFALLPRSPLDERN